MSQVKLDSVVGKMRGLCSVWAGETALELMPIGEAGSRKDQEQFSNDDESGTYFFTAPGGCKEGRGEME